MATNVFSFPNNGSMTLLLEPMQRAIEGRLEKLIRLDPGWDGYQGKPVRFETAVFALRVLEWTWKAGTPPPEIVPGTDGDLQLEWHLEFGDVELHVHSPNRVTAWRRLVTETASFEEEKPLTTDFSTVASWIKCLMEAHLAPRAAAA